MTNTLIEKFFEFVNKGDWQTAMELCTYTFKGKENNLQILKSIFGRWENSFRKIDQQIEKPYSIQKEDRISGVRKRIKLYLETITSDGWLETQIFTLELICESEPYTPATIEKGGVWGINPISLRRIINPTYDNNQVKAGESLIDNSNDGNKK